jgi:hypothetical protein
LRIKGAKGSFFFSDSIKKKLIILSTGTGIVMSLIDEINEK